MLLISYWVLLFVFPWAFIWSFFWLSSWKYIKLYIAFNISVFFVYALTINHLSRNNLDGWGVVLFSFLAVYTHFIIGTTTAFLIEKMYLQKL